MLRAAFSLLFASSLLLGETPSLQTLNNYPRSLAKDFYIWYFLQGNLSPKQADELFAQSNHVGTKLYTAYAKQSDNPLIRDSLRCFKLKDRELLSEADLSCVTLALKPYQAARLSPQTRQILIERLQEHAPETARWLEQMNSSERVEETFKDDPKNFLILFQGCGRSFRSRHFDQRLSQAFLEKISQEPEFATFVESVAIDKSLKNLRASLQTFVPYGKISTHAKFYLGLIKIMEKRELLALSDFMEVAQSDYLQMNRDKALFWIYLITKEEIYLEKLYKSTDLNLYTLFAAETLGREYIGSYAPKLPKRSETLFDESNPFIWRSLLIKDKNISAEEACESLKFYESDKTQALYAFYLQKCGKYAIHPYVTPYLDELKSLKSAHKALFYAIGKQESHLIAGGLSPVFAMGMMQIMPFLSRAIAKQKREPLFLPDMFKPAKNIEYATFHLKNLQRKLKHPLLIAYAYNGGGGYLKKQLKKGLFRRSSSKYEPYLSMELLSYPETREYGKKVLANYIIYSDLFEKPTSLIHLFHTLAQ